MRRHGIGRSQRAVRKPSAWRVLTPVCMALLLLGGCNPSAPPGPEVPDKADNSVRALFESADPAALQEPGGGALFDRLCDAAVASGDTAEEEAAAYLVEHFGDEDLGLFALRSWVDRLRDSGRAASATAYCAGIVDRDSGQPVEALALDLLLQGQREKSVDQFLETCTDALESSHERMRRIALLAHIDYCHKTGKTKHAALESIEFWTQHPDAVSSGGLATYLEGNLERAGWVVELDVLESAGDPSYAGRSLLKRFQDIGLKKSLDSGQSTHPLQNMYTHAPDVDAILQHAQPDQLTAAELAHTLLQCARLELAHLDSERAPRLYTRYLQEIQQYLSTEAPGTEDLAYLRTLNRGAAYALWEFLHIHADSQARAHNVSLSTRIEELRTLGNDLADLHLRLHMTGEQKTLDPSLDVAGLFDYFIEINQPATAEETLVRYIEQHDDSPRVPELLMELAKVQVENLENPRAASESYLRVFYEYPESTFTERAALLGCITLIDLEEYSAAYENLQLLLGATGETNTGRPTARYLSGLCEAGLGQTDSAFDTMESLLDNHPDSPVGAKALMWQASTRLGQQEYRLAQTLFQDLTRRYPESEEARKAQDYLKRLEGIADAVPR